MKSKSWLIALVIVACGIIISLFFYHFQPPNNFAANAKADANEYLKIYEYFQGERDWHNVRFGIHNRIVIPYLAAMLPIDDPLLSFFIINSIFAIFSVVALYHLLRFFNLRSLDIILIITFFSLHYMGPLRQNAVNPINVDMPVYLFEILLLLFLIKRKYLLLILLTPIAVATKEMFLALVIVAFVLSLVWRFLFDDKTISIVWTVQILLLGIITKWMLNEIFPSPNPGRNSVIVMAFHIRELILNPDHLWRWFLSLFAAFGGFLLLLVKRYKIRQLNTDNILLIHAFSISVLALSIVGGMDYTRLIFLGFPFVITSIFLISKPGKMTIWIAFFISMILSRFWIKMPVISTDLSLYNLWMPEWSDLKHLFIWTFLLIFCLGIFLLIKRVLRNAIHS